MPWPLSKILWCVSVTDIRALRIQAEKEAGRAAENRAGIAASRERELESARLRQAVLRQKREAATDE